MLNWLRSHNLVWILSIALVFWIAWTLINSKKLKLKAYQAIISTVLQLLIAVFYLKLFAWFEALFSGQPPASLRLYGPIFFVPLSFFIQAKLTKCDPKIVFDTMIVGVVFAIMLGRGNCLIVGCCGGRPLGDSGIILPIREIEMALNGLFVLIAAPMVAKGKTHGKVYPIYLIVYGAFRFIAEFARDEGAPIFGVEILHLAHIWSLISLIAGVIILVIMTRKEKQNQKHNKKGRA